MKILLATSSVTPFAGIPSFNREVCSMLNTEHEVHLLVEESINSYQGYSKVISISGINQSSFRDCSIVLKTINAEEYDLIINSNSHLIARLAPFIVDKSVIITVSHSLRYTDSDNATFNYKYLDYVIALSGYNKEYMEHKFHKMGDKIRVIPNFVSEMPDSVAIRERKKDNPILKIVYAGGSAPSKSPEIVLKCIKALQKTALPFEFYWMGVLTPPLKKIQPFNDVSILIPKDDRIVFTGKIPRQEATKLIAECNVFLAPSRREGCSMALLEAMRVGTISLVADYKISNREIVKDGVNGFILPHKDIDSFVNKITDIILHHDDYKRIYDESYYEFLTNLSYPVWSKKISLLINGSAANHSCRKKKMSFFSFQINKIRFDKMHFANIVQMIFREIIPSAWPIYKMYKEHKFENNERD